MPTCEQVRTAARAASARLDGQGWSDATECYVPSVTESTLERVLQALGVASPPPAERRVAVELELPSPGFYLGEEGELFEQTGTSSRPPVLRPIDPSERLPVELPYFEQALENLGR